MKSRIQTVSMQNENHLLKNGIRTRLKEPVSVTFANGKLVMQRSWEVGPA